MNCRYAVGKKILFPFCTETESFSWRDLIIKDMCKCWTLNLVDSNMHDVHQKKKEAEMRSLHRIRVKAERFVKNVVFLFCLVCFVVQARSPFVLCLYCPKSLTIFSFYGNY